MSKSTLRKYSPTTLRSVSHAIIFTSWFLDGEFKLCMRIDDSIFSEGENGIKSVKTKLFFSNEYYNCKQTQYINEV